MAILGQKHLAGLGGKGVLRADPLACPHVSQDQVHPDKSAPVHEVDRCVATRQAPAPVLIELERPSDARSEVRQIDSRRLCRHHPLPRVSYQPRMKAACQTIFGKPRRVVGWWETRLTATSSTGR